MALQCVLGLMSSAILVAKKKAERSDRTWFEFGLDSSKQLYSAGWAHVSNLFIAVVFSTTGRGTPHGSSGIDSCTWYAANIIMDCTLGVLVELILLTIVTKVLMCCKAGQALETGVYFDAEGRFSIMRYVSQVGVWLSIVTVMKLMMVAILTAFPAIVAFLNAFLEPLDEEPQKKLVIVMVLIPLVMNTVQFLLTDAFIKRRKALPSRGNSLACSLTVEENPALPPRDVPPCSADV